MDLFEQNLKKRLRKEAPLAERTRPESLDEFVGQKEIIGAGKLLRQAIERDEVPSIIFWGPPGSGKTTLARIVAQMTKSAFVQISAVTSGLKDLRQIIKSAQEKRKFNNLKTILFIDEVHRWNKSQQDALLPYIEDGTIILIGATTENPSFEVISALLSRCRVFVLKALSIADLTQIIKNAIADKKKGLGHLSIQSDDETLKYLAVLSNGDARIALNALEFAVNSTQADVSGKVVLIKEVIKESLQKSHFLYDKGGEQHYNIISALHKSLRGSDANASLYWLARMLEAGEDPLYVARRLVRFASEDIGLADSQALGLAVAAYQASHFIGLPECNVILAQAVVYLAMAPKSAAIYKAYLSVKEDVQNSMDEPVPMHLRNAPTQLMKDLGYGQDYKYNPDFSEPVKQDYLPPRFKGRKYFDDKIN